MSNTIHRNIIAWVVMEWLWNAGAKTSQQHKVRIGAEEVKRKQAGGAVLLNTLPLTMQDCLIGGTLPANEEVVRVNDWLEQGHFSVPIVVYGRNSADTTADAKERQLRELGFTNVLLYLGGMLEWSLLQDVYGKEAFPTAGSVVDIVAYH